jgi:ABC-type polysaccharide/polyol phosphate transport system ATPase subunit
MLKDIAIKLTNVSKKYMVHHEKPTLAERILNGKNEEFWALKNINLTINKGERIGIIGPNGSGKTTLLKLITGIATPTKGKIETNGKIVSLIDLEAGFHPDLSGITNIYLNGTVLGMSKKEIDEKLDEIIKFADIGKFIDAPLFTYSSGMKLRLGFSIAVYSEPKILLLDEIITVGDSSFRRKIKSAMRKMVNNGVTIVLISQWLNLLKSLCNTIYSLNNAEIYKNTL